MGEAINATFLFIRQNLRGLLRPLLYYAVPFGVGAGLFTALGPFGAPFMFQPIDPDFFEGLNLGRFLSLFGLAMLFSFFAYLLAITLTYAYVMLYVERGPDAFDYLDVWALAKQRLWRMAGTVILVGLCFMVPFVIFIIPCLGALAYMAYAVWAMVVFSILLPMRMQEEVSFGEAFGRSRALLRDMFWPTLGVLFVVGVVYYIISIVFSMPVFIIGVVGVLHEAGTGPLVRVLSVVFTVISTAASIFLYVLPVVATAVQYYNLAEQKDRTGLIRRVEAMAAELEPSPEASPRPPAPFAPPPSEPPSTRPSEPPSEPSPEASAPPEEALVRVARVLDVAPDAPADEVRAQVERLRTEAERERLHALRPADRARVEEKLQALDDAYALYRRLRGF